MSTFTEWNGPAGYHGPSTRDIAGLINEYQELSRKLLEHINETVPNYDVHHVKSYVEDVKVQLQQTITAIERALSTKQDSGEYITSPELTEILKGYTSKELVEGTLEDYIKGTALESTLSLYVSKDLYESYIETNDTLIQAIKSFVDRFNIEDDNITACFNGILAASGYLRGRLHAHEIIDFTKWVTVAMQFAGTGSPNDASTNGLYVIGKLSDDWSDDIHAPTRNIYKAARAFIKYEDGSPFDAIIDMVVTKHGEASFTGAMNAIVSKQPGAWGNLRFHLVRCTSTEGIESIYLCMSADGLDKSVQQFNAPYVNMTVHAAGINFLPLDASLVKRVSKVDDVIVSTSSIAAEQGSGVIASSIAAAGINVTEISTDIIRDAAGNIMLQMQAGVDHRHLLVGDKTIDSIQLWKRPTVLSVDSESDTGVIEDRLATVKDLQSLASVPLGGIIIWPKYEEVYELDADGNPVINELTGLPELKMLRAIEVPEGFLPTDARKVLSVDYSDLSKELHHEDDVEFELPLRDCGIIKVKMDIDSGDEDDPERITVLNYNQLVDLIKYTSKNLKEEIERSTAKDTEHDTTLDSHDTTLNEHDRILNSHDQSIDNLNNSVNNVASALDAEINRSTAEDAKHDATDESLFNTADSLNTAINNVAGALDNEITRATQAEAAETNRATTEEQQIRTDLTDTITTAIQTETDRATSEEQRIEQKIDDEVTRSTDKDTEHDSQITDIKTVIDEEHSVPWNRWKAPVTVEILPAGIDIYNYIAGDRIYVSSQDRRYYLVENAAPDGTVTLEWSLVGNGPWE